MADQYRLVFTGEVVDGQHPAVVKKRLSAAFKLDDERAEVLFSGAAVVVKKAADEATATRYQRLFDKVGARLQVTPIEAVQAEAFGSSVADAGSDPSAPSAQAAQASGGTETSKVDTGGVDMTVLPAGADLLTEAERPQIPRVEIDTDHLKTQGVVFVSEASETQIEAPDVDHIELAELGAPLSDAEGHPLTDLLEVNFDLAELGADLDTTERTRPPPAPDTSHIEIAADEPQSR